MSSARSLMLLSLLLGGCVTALPSDPVARNPDHRIVVAPETPGGKRLKAYPPICPAWSEHRPDPNDNMPLPQTGCANQRNLALMVAEPSDLLGKRKLGTGNGQRESAALQRYQEGKTLGLYDPNTPPAAKE